jgi:hypothetical protein
MAELDVLTTCVQFIKKDVEEIKGDIKDIKQDYLTSKQFKSEFEPVRNVVYGMVATILLTVLAAVLYIIINKGA